MLLTATVLYSTLLGDKDRVVQAERGLNFAVRFYLRGFEHFINFYRHRHESEQQEGLIPEQIQWREMIVQCAWVVVAWTIVYFSVHSLISHI
jgi:hypothetical protein